MKIPRVGTKSMPSINNMEARVTFENGLPAHMMAIDGTWRRGCSVSDVSPTEATLMIKDPIEGLNLKEFFLLLSSPGLAYRRCSLSWVNGEKVGVTFIRQQKSSRGRQDPDQLVH
jgi:hypothetical protein